MSKIQDCKEPFACAFNHCTEVAIINPSVKLEIQCYLRVCGDLESRIGDLISASLEV